MTPQLPHCTRAASSGRTIWNGDRVLYWHLPGGTEEYHETNTQQNQLPGRYAIRQRPEHETCTRIRLVTESLVSGFSNVSAQIFLYYGPTDATCFFCSSGLTSHNLEIVMQPLVLYYLQKLRLNLGRQAERQNDCSGILYYSP